MNVHSTKDFSLDTSGNFSFKEFAEHGCPAKKSLWELPGAFNVMFLSSALQFRSPFPLPFAAVCNKAMYFYQTETATLNI